MNNWAEFKGKIKVKQNTVNTLAFAEKIKIKSKCANTDDGDAEKIDKLYVS